MPTTRHGHVSCTDSTLSIRSTDSHRQADVPCSYGSLTDAFNDPQTQWFVKPSELLSEELGILTAIRNDAGAAAAWVDVVERWKQNGQSPADFSNHLANFFNARLTPNW